MSTSTSLGCCLSRCACLGAVRRRWSAGRACEQVRRCQQHWKRRFLQLVKPMASSSRTNMASWLHRVSWCRLVGAARRATTRHLRFGDATLDLCIASIALSTVPRATCQGRLQVHHSMPERTWKRRLILCRQLYIISHLLRDFDQMA